MIAFPPSNPTSPRYCYPQHTTGDTLPVRRMIGRKSYHPCATLIQSSMVMKIGGPIVKYLHAAIRQSSRIVFSYPTLLSRLCAVIWWFCCTVTCCVLCSDGDCVMCPMLQALTSMHQTPKHEYKETLCHRLFHDHNLASRYQAHTAAPLVSQAQRRASSLQHLWCSLAK